MIIAIKDVRNSYRILRELHGNISDIEISIAIINDLELDQDEIILEFILDCIEIIKGE